MSEDGRDPPVDVLTARVRSTPDRTAVIDTQTAAQWRYRELNDAVDEVAGALCASVDEPSSRERLAVALGTTSQFVVTLHACLRLGWELLPLNTELATPELAARLHRSDPTILICERATEENVIDAVANTDLEIPVRTVDDPRTGASKSLFDRTGPVDPSPVGLDETAMILFTSGTTGRPKGVELSRKNVLWSAIASAFRLGVTPSDRWLCCLPTYHMGGLAPAIRSVLYGTTLLLQRSFEARETASIIAEEGVTGVSLVPTQLKRLLNVGLSSRTLRTVLLGGAPASTSLLEQAAETSVPVYPTYGLTETASQVATARPSQVEASPGTVGQPLLGTQVRIVREGDPVPPGETGEVVVSGPTVTAGYLDEAETAEAFGEFGLHTGDLGHLDTDGKLWVTGRRDDQIITGGELVAPADVSAVLREIEGVKAAAVVGLDDPEWGQRVGALVVPDSAASDSEDLRGRILDQCERRLASYKQPKTVAFVDQLPRTHSGTVDRDAVRNVLTQS